MAASVGSEAAFVDRASIGFAWRVLRNDPTGWGISLVGWVLFFAAPIPIGLLALAVFDRAPTDDDSVWLWLAALGGLEVGRWALLGVLIVQWHGCWVFWHTVPRLNIMQSLVADPGPVSGRLPGSSGEAVSRFRDDTRDVAMVLDVWLDVVAASVTTLAAFVVLAYIDPFAALAIVAPVVAVLWFGHLLGRFIRQWRWDDRPRHRLPRRGVRRDHGGEGVGSRVGGRGPFRPPRRRPRRGSQARSGRYADVPDIVWRDGQRRLGPRPAGGRQPDPQW